MTEHNETLYKYNTGCRDCGAAFTAPVRFTCLRGENGDYRGEAVFNIPTRCDKCREGRIPLRRSIDIDDVYLPLWGRLLALVRDPAPNPLPTQDEQIEILLEIIQRFVGPSGEFDHFLFEDTRREAPPFWYATQHLDDEHYAELKRRAQEEYNVDVDWLAEVGKAEIGERYGEEVLTR